MEVHCGVKSVLGRRVWNKLRMALLMVRKGIISKRKLLIDMNLMMKRGKLLRKTLTNLIFHHHHHHSSSHSSPPPPPRLQPLGSGGFRFRLQDYEFSCSNSPNPVFFHVAKRKHHYLNLNLKGHFPCINPPPTPLPLEDDESDTHRDDVDMADVLVFPNNNNLNKNSKQQQLPHHDPSHPEPGLPHSYSYSYSFRFESPTPGRLDHLFPGEAVSPLLLSPFSVRISNYSDEDEDENENENDNDVGDANSRGVDDEAEEFIKTFYEQLRVQNRTQLLQSYEEEMQYQEMLARGTR